MSRLCGQSPVKNWLRLHGKSSSPDSRGEVPARSRQAGIPPNRAENFSCNCVQPGLKISHVIVFSPGWNNNFHLFSSRFSARAEILFAYNNSARGESSISWLQKCIQLYSLLLSHSHNTSVQQICSIHIPQTCTNKSFETLFVCCDGISVKWQHSIFQTSSWTNLKFKRIPGETLSHLTYVEMSTRDSKNLPQKHRQVSSWRSKSMGRGYKFLSKWDQRSQFGFTQICSVSSLWYFHVSILYNHVSDLWLLGKKI